MKMGKIADVLGKYKYPLIILVVGLVLLALPSGSKSQGEAAIQKDDEQRLEMILESSMGVGQAKVLLSENGAVIVCDGAANPEVKLCVIKATEAFTGLGCDEIQVLKTKQN